MANVIKNNYQQMFLKNYPRSLIIAIRSKNDIKARTASFLLIDNILTAMYGLRMIILH